MVESQPIGAELPDGTSKSKMHQSPVGDGHKFYEDDDDDDDHRKGAISVVFVHPSVLLSVCPFVPYIANNLITQRPSVPKFGMKVPDLRCHSHASFKVKRVWSGLQMGGGIPCRPNPAATLLVNIMLSADYVICLILSLFVFLKKF